MHEDVIRMLRVGELRNALKFISDEAYNRVSKAMPMFSDVIKMDMDTRKLHLNVGISVMIAELQIIQNATVKYGPAPSTPVS